MKKNNIWYQQGDVAIKPAKLSKSLKETGSLVLIESAVTNNTHSVYGAVRVLSDGKIKFLDAAEPFELRHQEHKTLTIPEGTYRVDAILEYDHWAEESRAVAD